MKKRFNLCIMVLTCLLTLGCSTEEVSTPLSDNIVREYSNFTLSSKKDSVVIDLGLPWTEISTLLIDDGSGRREEKLTIKDIDASGNYYIVSSDEARIAVYDRSNYWRTQGPWFVAYHPNLDSTRMTLLLEENNSYKRTFEITLQMPDNQNHCMHLRTISVTQTGQD